MPRGSRESLTGGSGDVNPQTFVVDAKQSAADTSTITQLPLPIPRLPTRPGRNLVIELLAIDFYHTTPAVVGSATVSNLITVTTSPNVATSVTNALLDPRAIDVWYKVTQLFVATAAIVAPYIPVTSYRTNLTDEAGHGILVATDNLYFGVYSISTQAANEYVVQVTYRWKDVSLTEYIGIVQSQQ